MDVQFIDTTFRDGSQSLWASGMRTGMMEAVAQTMDQVGFAAIEVPINGIYFKKIVRDLKEDPWELMRSLGRRMPNTIKGGMAGGFILPFEPPPPRSLIELLLCLPRQDGRLQSRPADFEHRGSDQTHLPMDHSGVQGPGRTDCACPFLHDLTAPHR